MKSKEMVILLVAWFNISSLGGCNHHEDNIRILETENARLSSRIANMAAELTAAELNLAESEATRQTLLEQLERAQADAALGNARLDEAKLHVAKTVRALEDARAAVLKAEAEIFALKMQVTRLTGALQERGNLPFPPIPVPREPPRRGPDRF